MLTVDIKNKGQINSLLLIHMSATTFYFMAALCFRVTHEP
jgi:hypothetical protein